MNLFITSIKSGLLATILFLTTDQWFPTGVGLNLFLFCFFINFSLSVLMIIFTLIPFTWAHSIKDTPQTFRRYFHLYVLLSLIGYLSLVFILNFFNPGAFFIFGTAFITGLQSWVWYFKSPNSKTL